MENEIDQFCGYSMEELLPIIKRLSDKYTSKESTSIPYETAQQLLGAVLYCIQEYGENDEEETMQTIIPASGDTGIDAATAYQEGLEKVKRKVIKANRLYESILETFDAYENVFLYDTFVKGMPGFFLSYDSLFHPQNTILTMDYPVRIPIDSTEMIRKKGKRLCGIDAIYLYLQQIEIEQKFLQRFERNQLIKTFSKYHADYREIPINLYSML